MNIINKRIFGLIMLSSTVAFIGCYKDKSNKDLNPISNIKVSDIKSKTPLTILQGEILKLKPELSQSLNAKIDQLEFTWLVYDVTGNYNLAPRKQLSKEFELNYLIQGDPFILGQRYVLRLEVKDKTTGIASYLNYNVTVGNKYALGWLVLEDNGGIGDLSFVFPDNAVEHNIYSQRNTTVLVKPRKLEITPFEVDEEISAIGKRLYILAENGSQEYNYVTMVKKFDFGYEFYSAPVIQKPEFMNWMCEGSGTDRSPNLGIVINNGKAHSNLVGGFPGVKKWGDIALNPERNQNYSLAPFAVGGPSYAAIVYDNIGKRFCYIVAFSPNPSAGSLESFPASASTDKFDLNNVGMTMIFQDSADVVHRYNAVMKSSDNQPYLLTYTTQNATTDKPALTLDKVLMDAPGILNYSAASGSTSTAHIYYGNSNVLSRYQTSSNKVLETYSFPASEQITAIKFAKRIPNDANKNPRLVVATWNGTEGKLYYFSLAAAGGMGAYTNVFTGFKKIVDMALKY